MTPLPRRSSNVFPLRLGCYTPPCASVFFESRSALDGRSFFFRVRSAFPLSSAKKILPILLICFPLSMPLQEHLAFFSSGFSCVTETRSSSQFNADRIFRISDPFFLSFLPVSILFDHFFPPPRPSAPEGYPMFTLFADFCSSILPCSLTAKILKLFFFRCFFCCPPDHVEPPVPY